MVKHIRFLLNISSSLETKSFTSQTGTTLQSQQQLQEFEKEYITTQVQEAVQAMTAPIDSWMVS